MSYPQPPEQPPPGAPQYAPPVFVAPQSQPLGFTPPQAPKKSGAGKIVAGVLGLVLLLCLGGAALFAFPIISDQGATIALPAKIGNLVLDDGPEGKKAVDAMSSAGGSIAGHESKGALYRDGDKPVIFFGATGLNVNLKGQLDDAFKAMNATGGVDIDAGDLGGYIRCGTIAAQGDSPACVWIDHGSIGLAIFVKGDKATAGQLFQEMHRAMLSR
ncbi:hypothetical protein Lfu02_53340 [Longispora fulva]|uniref:Uncharacterized protein n=1 Tax=Longispora fulva TaxID=619741 RepID=A0A8J7GXB7_9ACTN|nr:hypothetical protein [Longispora fulva]MBG6140774.1 hypothetical protein [Longispora fulva]GIG60962.1 hypothetical protein Lfu02_53340 [Longispora fulva]